MMTKLYIILPLTLLMLAGCSDKNNEPNEETTSAIVEDGSDNTGGTTPVTADPVTVDPVIVEAENIRERIIEEDDNITEVIVAETIPANWYIRLVAEDSNRSLRTNLSQLGELEESDAVQQHTLISGGRFSNPYLDVIFVNPDGMPVGNYKTNYHVYGESINDSWHFTVETDDVNAQVRLSWNGLYVLTPSLDAQNRTQYTEYRSSTNPLIAKMKLIDNDTGVIMPAISNNEVQTYTFNMNGKITRNFSWEIQYD